MSEASEEQEKSGTPNVRKVSLWLTEKEHGALLNASVTAGVSVHAFLRKQIGYPLLSPPVTATMDEEGEEETKPIDDGGGPAFPGMKDHTWFKTGMTLRDYFAGQALIGQYTNFGEGWDVREGARLAYVTADEMLKARKEETKPS